MEYREQQKQLYREYIQRLTPYINWHMVCKKSDINYTNFRQFREGVNSRMSLMKLRILFGCVEEVIFNRPENLEDIADYKK